MSFENSLPHGLTLEMVKAGVQAFDEADAEGCVAEDSIARIWLAMRDVCKALTYRGWVIEPDFMGWWFQHPYFDPEKPNDWRYGHANSIPEARDEIDRLLAEDAEWTAATEMVRAQMSPSASTFANPTSFGKADFGMTDVHYRELERLGESAQESPSVGQRGYVPYCGGCSTMMRMHRDEAKAAFVCRRCGLETRRINGENMWERTAPELAPPTPQPGDGE